MSVQYHTWRASVVFAFFLIFIFVFIFKASLPVGGSAKRCLLPEQGGESEALAVLVHPRAVTSNIAASKYWPVHVHNHSYFVAVASNVLSNVLSPSQASASVLATKIVSDYSNIYTYMSLYVALELLFIASRWSMMLRTGWILILVMKKARKWFGGAAWIHAG